MHTSKRGSGSTASRATQCDGGAYLYEVQPAYALSFSARPDDKLVRGCVGVVYWEDGDGRRSEVCRSGIYHQRHEDSAVRWGRQKMAELVQHFQMHGKRWEIERRERREAYQRQLAAWKDYRHRLTAERDEMRRLLEIVAAGKAAPTSEAQAVLDRLGPVIKEPPKQ